MYKNILQIFDTIHNLQSVTISIIIVENNILFSMKMNHPAFFDIQFHARISFIKTINSIGAQWPSWGTPDVTWKYLEVIFFIFTAWHLWYKKSSSQISNRPKMPNDFNWLTLSKAFSNWYKINRIISWPLAYGHKRE